MKSMGGPHTSSCRGRRRSGIWRMRPGWDAARFAGLGFGVRTQGVSSMGGAVTCYTSQGSCPIAGEANVEAQDLDAPCRSG